MMKESPEIDALKGVLTELRKQRKILLAYDIRGRLPHSDHEPKA